MFLVIKSDFYGLSGYFTHHCTSWYLLDKQVTNINNVKYNKHPRIFNLHSLFQCRTLFLRHYISVQSWSCDQKSSKGPYGRVQQTYYLHIFKNVRNMSFYLFSNNPAFDFFPRTILELHFDTDPLLGFPDRGSRTGLRPFVVLNRLISNGRHFEIFLHEPYPPHQDWIIIILLGQAQSQIQKHFF